MERNSTVGNNKIASLFDCGTFVQIGAHIKRSGSESAYDGVLCGYGSISGKLAFAFIQDSDRTNGALDITGAKKICMLYDMAIKNGAPVIGVFDSAGAVVLDGSQALSAYGKVMSCVSKASGIIPQIAIIDGICTGMSLCTAAMFDMIINVSDKSCTYVNSESKDKGCSIKAAIECEGSESAYGAAKELIEMLPQNNNDRACSMSGDDPARAVVTNGLCGCQLVQEICDNGKYTELYSGFGAELSCSLAFFGGELCGVIASDDQEHAGKITSAGASKAAEFIGFCDRFGLPVITLVNSEGFGSDICASAPASLAMAYSNASTPKITVICGKAYGAGFTLLGSRSVGADIAYATSDSYISVMSPESAVAFLMNDKISAQKSRAELEGEWLSGNADPIRAAESGDIDDIIPREEIRARIVSAVYMLATKTDLTPTRKHYKMPL